MRSRLEILHSLYAGRMGSWIDISLPLRNRMQHWPGDISPEFSLSEMRLHPHTGTHIDAPLHFIPGALTIDAMPPEATIGPARVLQMEAADITAAVLAPLELQRGERVLFRTANSKRHWRGSCFRKQFAAVTPDGARHLAERGVRTVGIDYLSIGPYGGEGCETHTILLGAGIWVIEGLNLQSVAPGEYELICLPLRIEGGDGAPARAFLRLREAEAASYSED
jgi:arylformamidase